MSKQPSPDSHSSDPSSSSLAVSKPRPLALLWQLTRGFRGMYALAIASLLVFTVISFATPFISGATIDFVLTLDRANVSAEPTVASRVIGWMGGAAFVRENLWLPALLIILLTIAAGVFNYLKGRCAAMASDGIALWLKDSLYDHLQRLPARYHDRAETGDLIQRCTSDVETLRLALAAQVVEIAAAVFLLLTALPAMIMLDGRMTAISLVLVGPIFLFGYFYIGRVQHLFMEVDKAEGEVTRRVQENLTGLRVVRAFARQPFEIEKFAGPNRVYRDRSLRLLRLMAWYWSTSDLIALSQQGLTLIAGAWFVSQGTLTVGTLFTFIMLLNMLLWPVRQLGRTLTELGKSIVALRRMGEILSEPEESKPEGADSLPTTAFQGKIEVKDLVFGHDRDGALTGAATATGDQSPAQAHAVNGVSFTVQAGETLAILGPSGAGKSTLMHLLLRLYDYTGGSIRLDGRELSGLDRQWVRSQFSVVMQEPFLYSKTIAENIGLGGGGAALDEAEIREAARMADIHDTIASFPASYDTRVGERGVTLSGGQRQRVALARALLRETPVLLLDDALSAVDAETESNILQALRDRHGRRTTLVIAHRLSTLSHADRVIVLDKGRIIQEGTHHELLAREGLYRRLWTIQNAAQAELSADAEADDDGKDGDVATCSASSATSEISI